MKVLGIALAALSITSCAVLDGKSRELDVMDGSGVSLDISRRAVLTTKRVDPDDDRLIFRAKDVRVCAEPSPDAMTTLAVQGASSLDNPGGTGGAVTGSLQENGAFVGLRTQSIQLLRDSMYRTCEAYLSGAIDKDMYALLLRRHQRYMLALLSIEALTGTVRAPTVTVSTESMASAARSYHSLANDVKDVEAKLETLEAERAKLVAERNKDGADTTALDIEIQKKEAEIKEHETKRDLFKNAMENTAGLLASGTTRVEVSNVGVAQARSDEHIQKVADAVKETVKALNDTDDLGSLCFGVLNSEKPTGEDTASVELKKICLTHLLSAIPKNTELKINKDGSTEITVSGMENDAAVRLMSATGTVVFTPEEIQIMIQFFKKLTAAAGDDS